MATSPERTKLLPRNVAAARRGHQARDANRLTPGNPVSTRMESGVGNCFPGLECDLRNLERRFFPYLEVNIGDGSLDIVGVDIDRARVDQTLAAGALTVYERIKQTLAATANGSNWKITKITGNFGPLGPIAQLDLAALRQPTDNDTGTRPPDCWTAIRLLKEGSQVTVTLRGPNGNDSLSGPRARYLGDDGALAAMFLPGELTQSLCSPWTHDFRDCGCYYWASNHPDIAQPLRPAGATDPGWNNHVDWERADRGQATPPPSSTANGPGAREMGYYEINNRWQQLHFVVQGRERVDPLTESQLAGTVIQTDAELDASLRLAAGIELAVMHEYLCAAFSLAPDTAVSGALARAVKASRAELMRVAIGEMRHLRVVNEALALLQARASQVFQPALRVSLKIPTADLSSFRGRQFRPLNAAALQDFIAVETSAHAVDQLYGNVMATFRARGNDHLTQVIASIISDGQDHLETFQFMQEWLAPFGAAALRPNLVRPGPGEATHMALQSKYKAVLENLHAGYSAGLPAGAQAINTARQAMVQPAGLMDLANAVANAGFLVVFDDVADPRFAPI